LRRWRGLRWPSWCLWKALTDGYPIPLPSLAQYGSPRVRQSRWRSLAEFLPVAALLLSGLYITRYSWRFFPEALLLIALLPVSLFLILFYTSFLPEFDLLLQVSHRLYSDQLNGRFDLLSIQPHGIACLYWTTALYHYRVRLIPGRARKLMRHLAAGFTLITAFVLLPAVFVVLIRDISMSRIIDTQSLR
jgi:hypothetical protein